MVRIYVGNLPESATAADLQALFSQYGEPVSADLDEARARGVAYVEMPDRYAELAIDGLNGHEFRAAELIVHPAARLRWQSGKLLHAVKDWVTGQYH